MIKDLINKIAGKKGHRTAIGGKTSYAQCGEDLIIQYIFNLRGIPSPSYLDIGANHPYHLNNTAIFYLQGCRGINVEANPSLVNLFKENRPKDITLQVGVAPIGGTGVFYELNDHTLSTFSEKEALDQVNLYGRQLVQRIDMPLVTLNEIVDQYASSLFPDLLSIDVEGIDYAILEKVDFSKSKPKIICAETAEYSPIGAGAKRIEMINLIKSHGYELYADTNLNSIFVEHNFWFI